jgi:predicted methyltransferase MtxX (methanogen marker protein 4)
MAKTIKIFEQKVNSLVKLGKPKIAFGLKEPNREILRSLKKAKKYADIILVGPEAIKEVKEFEKIIAEKPEEKIASMLASNEVDGIVRGTIDDFTTYEAYQKLTGEKVTLGLGLLEDPRGRQFFLTSASNVEGWSKEERLDVALKTANYVKEWGIEPKIAVFTGRRHETYPRKKEIRDGVDGMLNKTYEDAEWMVAELKKAGFDAKNWAIDLNPAVEDGCNILVPVNGMVGNQMFRVLLFCGGKILSATRLGLSKVYEDNSRTEKDFEFHIKWLVALINKKKNI